MVSWMAAWGDYDNDGYQDLLVLGYRATDQSILYHNNGDGTFTSVDVGSPLRDGENRPVAAWGDYDNDGFLDLFIARRRFADAESALSQQRQQQHWLKVKLVAKRPTGRPSAPRCASRPRSAARRSGRCGRSRQRRIRGEVAGLVAHFGLGDATNVDLVRIEWPSGNVQELTDVAPDQMLTRDRTDVDHSGPARRPASTARSR